MPEKIKGFDAEVLDEIVEFSDEKVKGPEVAVSFGLAKMRTLTTSNLIIKYDWGTVSLVQESQW